MKDFGTVFRTYISIFYNVLSIHFIHKTSLMLMKKLLFFVLTIALLPFFATAQKDKVAPAKAREMPTDTATLNFLKKVASLKYQAQGDVTVADGKGTISIPKGYKYLDPTQTNIVLNELWGNPPRTTDGMFFPEKMSPIDSATWAFVVTYDEDGHVEDADADKINYSELLSSMQSDIEAGSAERKKEGYPVVKLVGWAAAPYYDKATKTLHWAKELEFDEEPVHTLNYDVRILGRTGVISLNAVGNMANVPDVKAAVPSLLSAVKFKEGNTYSDFNPSIDKVAAVGIGGLVAGKMLAKAGLFAILLKYIKVVILAAAGAGTWLWKKIKGQKEEAA
jgi:uncharacterized membrane-anchored protein